MQGAQQCFFQAGRQPIAFFLIKPGQARKCVGLAQILGDSRLHGSTDGKDSELVDFPDFTHDIAWSAAVACFPASGMKGLAK